jgi:hypothetical protein
MSRARPRVPLTWCRSWVVAGAATQTQSSAEVVRDAFEAVDHAVANLRVEVEDFLAKVAVLQKPHCGQHSSASGNPDTAFLF